MGAVSEEALTCRTWVSGHLVARRRRRRVGDESLNVPNQRGGLTRLREHHVEAGPLCRVDPVLLGVAGDRNQRNRRCVALLPQMLSHLAAGQPRKIEVHDRDVWMRLMSEDDGATAVIGW